MLRSALRTLGHAVQWVLRRAASAACSEARPPLPLPLSSPPLQTAFPRISQLGRLPGTSVYRSVAMYPESEATPGVLLLRIDAPIWFANVEVRTALLRCFALHALLYVQMHAALHILPSTPLFPRPLPPHRASRTMCASLWRTSGQWATRPASLCASWCSTLRPSPVSTGRAPPPASCWRAPPAAARGADRPLPCRRMQPPTR